MKCVKQERQSVLGIVYFETKIIGGVLHDDILDMDEQISADGPTPALSYLALNHKLSTYIDDLTAAREEIRQELERLGE